MRPRPVAIAAIALIVVSGAALVAVVIIARRWWSRWCWAWTRTTSLDLNVGDGESWRVVAFTTATGVRVQPAHGTIVTSPAADGDGHSSLKVAPHLWVVASTLAVHLEGFTILSKSGGKMIILIEIGSDMERSASINSLSWTVST